jgi:hypothetical protein
MADKLIYDDLEKIKKLADDLAFYRTADDDDDLGNAAWIELYVAVQALPERPEGMFSPQT